MAAASEAVGKGRLWAAFDGADAGLLNGEWHLQGALGVATLSPPPAPRASGGAAPRRPRGERSARAVTLAQRPRGALGCSSPSTRAGSVLGVSLAAGGCCFQVTPDASPEWPELGCCVLTHYVFVFRGDWEKAKTVGGQKKHTGSTASSQPPDRGWFSTVNVETSLCCHVLRKGVVSHEP